MSRVWIIALCAAIGVGASAGHAAMRTTFDEPLGNSGWRVQGPGFYELQLAIDGEGVVGDIKWVAISIS